MSSSISPLSTQDPFKGFSDDFLREDIATFKKAGWDDGMIVSILKYHGIIKSEKEVRALYEAPPSPTGVSAFFSPNSPLPAKKKTYSADAPFPSIEKVEKVVKKRRPITPHLESIKTLKDQGLSWEAIADILGKTKDYSIDSKSLSKAYSNALKKRGGALSSEETSPKKPKMISKDDTHELLFDPSVKTTHLQNIENMLHESLGEWIKTL